MKNPIIKILVVVLIGFFAISHSAKSQEFGDIFKGGTEDANRYLNSYTESIMRSFNNGLSAGWYNTAETHKILGFDLTATVNIANIPSGERKFQFNQADYNNLRLQSGSDILPTAVGGETTSRLVIPAGTEVIPGSGVTYGSDVVFDAPSGADVEDLPIVGFPVPAFQLGVGLPKNTELIIRYASDLGAVEDGSFNLFGLGVKHDLKQWIPGLKQIPFDVSGFASFNRLKAEFDINENDPEFQADGVAVLKASSVTIQGIISKKISILTPYVGVGYNIASSSIEVNGDFTYTDTSPGGQSVTVTDPVSLDFTGASSPRINAGLRIKLLILTLHAEYAIQKYNTFTAGVGISIR
ncbi:MAG: hypothetical protein RLN88_09015 [Ekhidna sp.]|uniref:DUF6588 family protein n=1 Tax=Ekhidna sp. TaxID=2608089 RepID=UPI0032EB3541